MTVPGRDVESLGRDRRLRVLALLGVGAATVLGMLIRVDLPGIELRGEAVTAGLPVLVPIVMGGALLVAGESWRRWINYLYLIAALIVGFALRLHVLLGFRGTTLDPDAQTYQAVATSRGLLKLWDSGTWTPVHVYLVRLAYLIFGKSATIQRSLTVFLSLIVVAATFALARRAHGRFAAAAASMLVALSPFLLFSAARGLREEVFMLEILLFLWLLSAPKPSIRTGVAMGVVVGLAGLTRLEMLPPIGLVAAVAWLRRSRIVHLGVASLVAVALIAPQLLALQRDFHDPFHWTRVFTRGWVNIEYATGNLSEEAFERSGDGSAPLPTKPEIQKNVFAGSFLSPFDWYFKVHRPGEAVKRIGLGTVFLPLSSVRYAMWVRFGSFDPLTLELGPSPTRLLLVLATLVVEGMAVAGLGWGLMKRRFAVPLMIAAGGAVYAFPYMIGGVRLSQAPPVFDMRIVEFLIPLMAVGAGAAIELVASKVAWRISRR